jgi:hypothetical protein
VSDDVTFFSPLAESVVPGSGVVIRGKSALRDDWREGVRRTPNLHVEIDVAYLGITAIVITFHNHDRRRMCEVLFFEDGPVPRGRGIYTDDAGAAKSITVPRSRSSATTPPPCRKRPPWVAAEVPDAVNIRRVRSRR